MSKEHCTDVVGKHVMVVFEDMGHLDPKKVRRTPPVWASNACACMLGRITLKFIPMLSADSQYFPGKETRLLCTS